MNMAEFIARMQQGCTLPHRVYPESGEEFYYAQSMLSSCMLYDIDLYSPPLGCLGRPGMAGMSPYRPTTSYIFMLQEVQSRLHESQCLTMSVGQTVPEVDLGVLMLACLVR